MHFSFVVSHIISSMGREIVNEREAPCLLYVREWTWVGRMHVGSGFSGLRGSMVIDCPDRLGRGLWIFWHEIYRRLYNQMLQEQSGWRRHFFCMVRCVFAFLNMALREDCKIFVHA